jgi:serine/threonine protein kinase
VAHRDIKLENIMITTATNAAGGEVYYPKFIDFGLSTVLLEGQRSADRYGTLAYCSPEIISGGTHTHLTDVWSLGVVLYILLSGIVPFITKDKPTYKRNILLARLKLSHASFDDVSLDAKHLVALMLSASESQRLPA